MPVLDRHFRRYDFEGDLEKALNRVDFFRIFHTMALRYGFEHFGVLQLANEHETSLLASRLLLHDLPAGLAETYDKRYRFNDSAFFKSFYKSTIPTVWRASDRPDMGHDFYGVRTGGQISWNPKLVLFATANYENRDYGGTRPFFTKSQQDRQYEFSVGARYLPLPMWQIKPQLSYLNNDSNIPITDYDRWMVSVSFRHDFEW